MRRDPPAKRTPSTREWQVLDALWDLGPATVAEVRTHLNTCRELELAHTTVLTFLRSLHSKGWVRRRSGRVGHRYEPIGTRAQARVLFVGEALDTLFAGSVDALLESLMRGRRLGPVALRGLRQRIDLRLRELSA